MSKLNKPPAIDGAQLPVYDVTAFGAKGDGETRNTTAIQSAVDACTKAGGGLVFFPAGDYVSGTVVLKDNVTLYLAPGAVLSGSTNMADYPMKHLIYARGARRIGIIGEGTINGHGEAFRIPPSDPPALQHPSPYLKSPIYYWPSKDRPDQMIEFIECKDVHIRDITIVEPPNWTIHLMLCDRVWIQGITLDADFRMQNSDGLDIDACCDVMVSDCYIHCGDDAITLKNTGRLGVKRTCRNIIVTNCSLSTLCYGFKTGTESQASFEEITFSNSVIWNELELPHSVGGVGMGTVDGGNIRNVTVSNIVMRNVLSPILIRLGNFGRGQKVPTPGVLKGVSFSNIVAMGTHMPSAIAGLADHPVEDVTVSDFHVMATGGGTAADAAGDVPEMVDRYRFLTDFYRLTKGRDWPAHGIYCRHAKGVRFNNVRLEWEKPDARPAMICDNVSELDINGFSAKPPVGSEPVMRFTQVRDALLRGCRAAPETGTFLRIAGGQTDRITVTSSDLSRAAKPIDAAPEVPAGAVLETANRMPG